MIESSELKNKCSFCGLDLLPIVNQDCGTSIIHVMCEEKCHVAFTRCYDKLDNFLGTYKIIYFFEDPYVQHLTIDYVNKISIFEFVNNKPLLKIHRTFPMVIPVEALVLAKRIFNMAQYL